MSQLPFLCDDYHNHDI